MKAFFKCFVMTAAISLFASAAACADAGEEKAQEYLSEYYNIAPFTKSEATSDLLNEALVALGGEAVMKDEPDENALIAEGIRLAGLEELALSYENEAAPDKAKTVLAEYPKSVPEEYAPYVACALDLRLIHPDEEMDPETFLYRCIEIAGNGRHYLGRIRDDDILSVMRTTLSGFSLFDEAILTDLGKEIVFSGAASGYSLKNTAYAAHFLADNTIKYGHEGIQHLIQLVGLLKSEGYDGYVQIEPKVSVYEYLLDWGTPNDPTPTYEVRQESENRYLCYAMEYELVIEFDTKEGKEAFHELIESYAKKYDDRVDQNGKATAKLLAGSWWQPLYSSISEMENEEYGTAVENIFYDKNGEYYISSITLPGENEALKQKVAELAPELEPNEVTLYVNPAFVRYLIGEDHQ